jgi:adenine-specific DNA-methyltransferase
VGDALLGQLRDGLGLGLDDAAIAAIAAASAGDPLRIGAAHEAHLATDRTRRRAGGVYYTPPHLVDLVIERVVGTTAAERGPALRVLDLACGAGVFLVAALRRLEAAAGPAGPALRARLAGGLVGVDIDPVAVDLARLALAVAIVGGDDPAAIGMDTLRAATAGITVGDALTAELPADVDAVIGNPPWGQKGYRFAPALARRLRAGYLCAARGPLDPSALFVERAQALAAPGGRWGLVLPDPILLKSHEAIRSLVLAGSAIEHIADAGRAFRGVGLDVFVLIARRGRPARDHRIAIWHRVPARWRSEPPPERSVPQAMFEGLPGRRFNLHLDEGDASLLARLAALPRFGDDFAIHEGVHSGNRRGALFRDRCPDGAGAPLVVGKDELRPFRLTWAGRWIDLDPDVIDRPGGGYANLGRPEWFGAGKLVVRRTGDRVVAARDRAGRYVSNNAFVALPRAQLSDDEVDAWLGLLNAGFATWWYRAQVPRIGRAFAELKIRELAALPRPPDAAWRAIVPALAVLARALEDDPGDADRLAELERRVSSAFAA